MTKAEIEHAMKTGELSECPVRTALKVIDGRWKILIFRHVKEGVNRFGALRRHLPWITQKMLTSRLRELEADGIIDRTVYPVVPPKVEYSVTAYGQTLFPMLREMWNWGEGHIQRQKNETLKNTVEVNGDVSDAIVATHTDGTSAEQIAVLNDDSGNDRERSHSLIQRANGNGSGTRRQAVR